MDGNYLLEIIKTWRNIYQSISISIDKKITKEDEEFYKKWNVGMLKVIAVLQATDDIINSPVEKHFIKAVENAKTRDIKKLDDIFVLLGEVEEFLYKKLKV